MNLKKVTITGADDSTKLRDLERLSAEFPFVEWGILLSKSSMGGPRFPSWGWLIRMAQSEKLNFSGHLCGRWVRDLVAGNFTFIDEMAPDVIGRFKRIQLNFHAIVHKIKREAFVKSLSRLHGVQYIFQIDGVNDHIVSNIYDDGVDAVPLYDLSGGAGILPEEWESPLAGILNGYAGGLGPDNLEAEIPKIAEAANGNDFWIDMETKVRSKGDMVFDIEKVTECLRIAEKFFYKQPKKEIEASK